eukprot:m.310244 g.310244  ORF g.310244 m.310244 type:complete len:567 (+) comp16474_c1_seq1:400-2100(+)
MSTSRNIAVSVVVIICIIQAIYMSQKLSVTKSYKELLEDRIVAENNNAATNTPVLLQKQQQLQQMRQQALQDQQARQTQPSPSPSPSPTSILSNESPDMNNSSNWNKLQVQQWLNFHGVGKEKRKLFKVNGQALRGLTMETFQKHFGNIKGEGMYGALHAVQEPAVHRIQSLVTASTVPILTNLETSKVTPTVDVKSLPNAALGTQYEKGPICTQLEFHKDDICQRNSASNALLCEFRMMALVPKLIDVSAGGEAPADVRGRSEDAEYCKFKSGSVILPQVPQVSTSMYHKKLFDVAVSNKHPPCDDVLRGTTLFYQRDEYANMWHSMNDWFNIHWIIEYLKISNVARIVWLDGHAHSTIDEVWRSFAPEVFYVKQLPTKGVVCFEHAVMVPKMSPSWSPIPHPSCGGMMARLAERIRLAYHLERPTTPSLNVVIDRQPYDAHPRLPAGLTKTSRMIRNKDDLKSACGDKLTFVQLEHITFRQQLKYMLNAKTLYGVHGAGMTFLIWLGKDTKAVEWFPQSHDSVMLFQFAAAWLPFVKFERVSMMGIGDEVQINLKTSLLPCFDT